jgi:hypothetical protein
LAAADLIEAGVSDREVALQFRVSTRDLLAHLFRVNGSTLTRAVHQVQLLLAEHGCIIPPARARFRTPADIAAFLANSSPAEIKPAC